ncbi:MAG: hypothetical protein E7653_05815 [Ruminococcaceae bacterium]|nr:hypothetical protein [Oscillospiraceae bacterium]
MKNKYLKLSYISLTLITSLLLVSCAKSVTVQGGGEQPKDTGDILVECEDLGDEYIDSFIFLGESTTYHMKSRGVLRDGTQTTQVWGPKNGTVNLDTDISSLKIVYPETGEELSVGEAVSRKKPKRMLLTFGLNGAVTKVKKGEKYFKTCYLTLINTIRSACPETAIIIQSCFPIGENMDMSAYTVDVKTLNGYIDTVNIWAKELAYEQGLGYLNTQEVLRDDKGFLKTEYQVGDGYHLSVEGYEAILKYIRTHTTGE